MKKAASSDLSKILWVLIIAQVLCCLFITGRQVFFNSSLKLWLSDDYFMYQKLQFMLGGDYQISLSLKEMPLDAGILVITDGEQWFLNYYMLPRRVYRYPGVAKIEEIDKVPAKWAKEKGIDYVLVYDPKSMRLLTVGKEINFK